MDNLNDNWLEDLRNSRSGDEPDPKSTEALPSSDDLELERIIQETIAENWGADFKPDNTDGDSEKTQFFAPHTGSNPVVDENGEREIDEDFLQGIFDAVAQDSEQLVGENANALQEEDEEEDEFEQDAKAYIREVMGEYGEQNSLYDEDDDPDMPVKKLRPKKKDGYGLFGLPHVAATAVWAALILFIGITVGRTLWLCAVDVLALGKTPKEVTLTITENDTISDIAKKLETMGLIRYPSLFETFANLTKKSEDIIPGTFTFDGKIVYDYNALINAMSVVEEEDDDIVLITIPEGYTCKQIYELFQERGVCTVAELEEYAVKGALSDYWFLEGLPRDQKYCLEGFLFPDTYEFYKESHPRQVFEKLLDTFDLRFTERLKTKLETLRTELQLDLSIYDIMIMASMVQKEKANELEGYTIASVYYNRLKDATKFVHHSQFQYLDCDATELYGIEIFGYVDGSNPYDTGNRNGVKGLPPTPICNPGLSSIDAALDPDEASLETWWEKYWAVDIYGNTTGYQNLKTGYYFFVLDKSKNEHVFATTYEQHEQNLKDLGYYDNDDEEN